MLSFINFFGDIKMADRKVILKVVSEVAIVIDEGAEIGDLDLQLYNDNEVGNVEDFQIIESEVLDSK